MPVDGRWDLTGRLTLILLTCRIWWAPNNASKWQMGFNLVFKGLIITHNDAPKSVGLLWTSDQSVAETATWQHTTITTDIFHSPGGIRTHNLSRRAAEELRLRPLGHWDRLWNFGNTNKCTILQSVYSLYYLAPTCFGIVAIFRKLTPQFH